MKKTEAETTSLLDHLRQMTKTKVLSRLRARPTLPKQEGRPTPMEREAKARYGGPVKLSVPQLTDIVALVRPKFGCVTQEINDFSALNASPIPPATNAIPAEGLYYQVVECASLEDGNIGVGAAVGEGDFDVYPGELDEDEYIATNIATAGFEFSRQLLPERGTLGSSGYRQRLEVKATAARDTLESLYMRTVEGETTSVTGEFIVLLQWASNLWAYDSFIFLEAVDGNVTKFEPDIHAAVEATILEYSVVNPRMLTGKILVKLYVTASQQTRAGSYASIALIGNSLNMDPPCGYHPINASTSSDPIKVTQVITSVCREPQSIKLP